MWSFVLKAMSNDGAVLFRYQSKQQTIGFGTVLTEGGFTVTV